MNSDKIRVSDSEKNQSDPIAIILIRLLMDLLGNYKDFGKKDGISNVIFFDNFKVNYGQSPYLLTSG